MAFLVKETKLEYMVVSSNKIEVVNWWVYGVEIHFTNAEEDYRGLPQFIVGTEQ